MGREQAQKIRTAVPLYRQLSFFQIKGTPLREVHKTDFARHRLVKLRSREDTVLSMTGDGKFQVTKFPSYETSKLRNFQVTKLPSYKIPKLQDSQVTKFPSYEIPKLQIVATESEKTPSL